jgi:hypothetical protein
MFLVIPITQDYGEFIVVGIYLLWWMNNEWGTLSINVITLRDVKKSQIETLNPEFGTHTRVGVNPVSAPLTR